MRASPRHCTRLHCLPRGRPGCVPAARRGEAAGETKSGQAIKRETMGKAKKHAGLAVLLAVLLAGCQSGPQRRPQTVIDGFAQGGTYHIVLVGDSTSGGLKGQLDSLLLRNITTTTRHYRRYLTRRTGIAPEPYQPRRNRYARPLYRQLHPDGRHDQPRERRPLRHHDQAPDGRLRLYRRPSRATAQRRFVVAVHRV